MLSRVPGFSGSQVTFGDVLQVMSAAKEASTDVIGVYEEDVAAFALALSKVSERVPGFLFVWGDVLQVIAAAKKEKKWPMWFIKEDVAPVAEALSTVPRDLAIHLRILRFGL